MIGRRQEDLSKVFDKTWKANHNDVAIKGRQKEKEFTNKMFNVPKTKMQIKNLTPEEKVKQLNQNINNAFAGQKTSNINNILRKWK